jgi:hypothetical protein
MTIDEQIEWIKNENWCNDYDPNKKTILIMDDREEIIYSVLDDLAALDNTNNFFLEDYNILTVSSKMAGFSVLDILEKAPKIEINFALLDVILGGKKNIDGKRKMVDGVDVALAIWEKFPNADILFFSGCIIETNDDPFSFKNKFDKYTDDDMNNYLMPKDITFEQELTKLSNFFNGFSPIMLSKSFSFSSELSEFLISFLYSDIFSLFK